MLTGVGEHLLGAQSANRNCAQMSSLFFTFNAGNAEFVPGKNLALWPTH